MKDQAKLLYVTPSDFVELGGGKFSAEVATRSRSLDFAGLLGWLPNPDPVLQKTGSRISIYRELLYDAQVGGAVQSRKAATLAKNWQIDTEGVENPQAAEIVKGIFEAIDVERFISDVLQAPLFGYQPLEIIWQPSGAYWLPERIIAKPAYWFVFDTENHLRFLSKENSILGELVPPMQFLAAQHNPEYDNPYGEAVLSRCYWPVMFKKSALRFWVTYIEKYGMPWVVVKYPKNTPEVEVVKTVADIDGMVQDGIIAVPEYMDPQVVTSGPSSGSSELYSRLLDWCNSEISKAILGHSASTDATPGKLGNDGNAGEAREDIANADKKLVENVANELIDMVYELNFPASGKKARFVLYKDEDVDQAIATRDQTLVNIGVRFTREYIKNTYQLKDEDFTVVDPKATPAPSPAAPATGGGTLGAFAERARTKTIRDFVASCCDHAEGEGGGEVPDDQAAVDALTDDVTPERMQEVIDKVVAPLVSMVQGASDYNEVLAKLADIYPKMNTAQLERELERVIFISDVIGRLSANGEAEED